MLNPRMTAGAPQIAKATRIYGNPKRSAAKYRLTFLKFIDVSGDVLQLFWCGIMSQIMPIFAVSADVSHVFLGFRKLCIV